MNALVPRERLACVLGMRGSEHDCEALAAARAAEMIRRQLGATWSELLTERTSPQPQRQPEPPVYGWRCDLAAVQRATHKLSEWERNFISSVAMQRGVNAKQAAILARLAAKLAA